MPNVNINAGEISSIRLKEQASAPAAVATGYWALHAMEGGLYHEDDNEVVAGPLGTGLVPGGRLTLTTATPVTTADVTAAATLYYTPYIHNMIELYDGARWIPVPFVEVSLSLVGYTASKPYDIWGYLAAGTVALESTIWTDGTTRATALAYQNGRLIKNGAATRRYLGTIYINSSGAQTDDSITKRFVWNYYNRLMRNFYKVDANSHSYTTAVWRSWNNDASVRFECVVGVVENPIILSTLGTLETAYSSIGMDVTNASSLAFVLRRNDDSVLDSAGGSGPLWPSSVGYHYFQGVELGTAGATQAELFIGGYING